MKIIRIMIEKTKIRMIETTKTITTKTRGIRLKKVQSSS